MVKLKSINKIKTGLISRHYGLAKILTSVAKDVYFSNKKSSLDKINEALSGKVDFMTYELSHLKGSLLKAGQMLSMYAKDLLPPEVEKILQKLQSETPYLEWEKISQQIPLDFLKDLEIEKEAFAAASIGQVHKAYQQENVYALKIQYKNIDKVIDLDIKVLKWLFKSLNIIPKAIDLNDLFDEIKSMLIQEMDYQKEAQFTQRFKTLAGNDYIVPTINKKYCNQQIICSEFIPGLAPQEAAKSLNQNERNRLAKDMFTLFFKELVDWKLVQSDSHLGNFLIHQNKWVLLDFGASKELDTELSQNYLNLIKMIIHNDFQSFEEYLTDHQYIDWSKSNRELLKQYIGFISEPFQRREYNWGETNIVKKIMDISPRLYREIKYKNLPYENFFIDRKVAGVFYILKMLKANGDIFPWEYLDAESK